MTKCPKIFFIALYTYLPRFQSDWEALPYPMGETWRILLLLCTSFVLIFTVMGNALTLFAVFRMKPLQSSVSNLYIASLAAADIIVGGFVMLFMMVYTVAFENEWVLGPIFCDIWQTVDFISITISLYSICAIGFDRWWNLEKPLRVFKRNRALAKRAICAVWAIPVLVWVPVVVGLRLANGGPPERKCEFMWKPKILVPLIAVPFLYVPVLILIVLFIRITFVIRSHLGFLYRHSNRTFIDFQRSMTGLRPFDPPSRSVTPNPPASPHRKLSCDPSSPELRQEFRRKPNLPLHHLVANGFVNSQAEGKRVTITHSPLAIRVMRERLATLKEVRSSKELSSTNNPATLQISPPIPDKESKVIKRSRRAPRETTPLLTPMKAKERRVSRGEISMTSNRSDLLVTQSNKDLTKCESKDEDIISIDSVASHKRSSVSSDTAVVFTRLHDMQEQQQRGHPKLMRANTEQLLRADLPKPRQGGRFSIVSIASNLFSSRRESVTLFSDFSGTPGLSQQIRAAKAVGLILIFFLLCWLPFLILWPVKTYCPDCVSDTVYNLSIWANYLNSTLNPVLYTLCSPRVQRALKSHCRCFRGNRYLNKTGTFQ